MAVNILRFLKQAKHQIQQKQYCQAIVTYQQVISLARQLGDKNTEALALFEIGVIYHAFERTRKAAVYYQQALLLYEELGDRLFATRILQALGEIYLWTFKDPHKALSYYCQIATLYQELKNHELETATIKDMGSIYQDLGHPQQALEHYYLALAMAQKQGYYSLIAQLKKYIAEIDTSLEEKLN